MITDMKKCTLCKRCLDACYADARVLQGEDCTVDELMEILEKDDLYYKTSGGGITFSGGEPFLYSGFIRECAERIHDRGWSVLVETCGQVKLEKIKEAADSVDIIYCDYKHYSPEEHLRLTGKDNSDILENMKWLDENFQGELILRYPYIPGCNDHPYAIEKFLDFAEKLRKVNHVVFLPFHRLGLDKYQGLGRMYEMGDMESLKVKDLKFLMKYEAQYDLQITVQ